jgi:hypothetical protein
MSKYEPLRRHLQLSSGILEFRFSDIEEVLGFRLPRSARRYAAWWSNNGGSHVQAKAWLEAGYETSEVRLTGETVRFVRSRPPGFGEMKQTELDHKVPSQTPPTSDVKKPYRHPAFGALKGTFTLLPDVDLTEPADPEWGKVYED